MNGTETTAARWAMLIYTTLSLVVAFFFLIMTLVNGNTYSIVARVGGMIWVFILSMIFFSCRLSYRLPRKEFWVEE